MSLKVLHILQLLFVITSVFGGKKKEIVIKVDDYHTCLPLLSRPRYNAAVPSQNIQMFGETFTATRHHVIPYETLSAFFNLVLSEDPLQSSLGAYLATRVRDIYNFFDEHDEVGAFPEGSEPAVRHISGPPLSVAGIPTTFAVDLRMLSAFTWMPGNIFYGPPPDRRFDDPGSNFEVNAERIVGSRTFSILQRIYNNMRNYIDNPSQRTSSNFDAILTDLYEIDQSRDRPYEFDIRDWFVTTLRGKQMFGIKKFEKGTEVIDEIQKRNAGEFNGAATFMSSLTDSNLQENYLDAARVVCQELNQPTPPTSTTASPESHNSCENVGYTSMAVGAAGVVAGATAGTVVIPVPIVGTILGGLFGGVIGGVTVLAAGC